MKIYHPAFITYLLIVTATLLTPSITKAQGELAASFSIHKANTDKAVVSPRLTRRERQRLLDFLKELNVPDVPYNESADKQWNKLATTFTKLRLYPLAMKCFFKTLNADSLINDDIPVTDNDEFNVEARLKELGNRKSSKEKIVPVNSILETFHDDKPALAYAMILHVKQPVRGTPKVHKLANTGHTFITLIKFNTDSSYTTLSFGFGPRKDNLLSATPIIPTTSSKFTDDSEHEWDEVIGKFITKHRFNKILELTHKYDGLNYNLSKNNCTDFGLQAAEMAGLQVLDTKATWLLGGGNNPGKTGESILLGKFINTDTGNSTRLFIDTSRNTPITYRVSN